MPSAKNDPNIAFRIDSTFYRKKLELKAIAALEKLSEIRGESLSTVAKLILLEYAEPALEDPYCNPELRNRAKAGGAQPIVAPQPMPDPIMTDSVPPPIQW